jgi:hypothetical protein
MSTNEPTPLSACLYVNYEGNETNAALYYHKPNYTGVFTFSCSFLYVRFCCQNWFPAVYGMCLLLVSVQTYYWLACVIKLLMLIKQNRSIYVVVYMLVHTRKDTCDRCGHGPYASYAC